MREKNNTEIKIQQLFIISVDKNILGSLNGERIVSSMSGVGKTGYSHKNDEIRPLLIPLTKIDLKWIEDLNITPETIKLLEKNIRKKILDIGLGNKSFRCDTKIISNKNKTNKWDYIKLKSYYTAKERIKCTCNLQNGRKY